MTITSHRPALTRPGFNVTHDPYQWAWSADGDRRAVAELAESVDELIPGAPRLTVIGTGYLGATHAVCMAARGYEVVGVDVDPAKAAALQAGRIPFHEPGLGELLTQLVGLGRLRFTTSSAEAAEVGDVHFICVGTPQRRDGGGADMSYVDDAVDSLAVHLRRPALVVGKSTVPVGTAQRLTERLHRLAPAGSEVDLAWNPEFLREGYAVADTLAPDRLVFGVTSARAERLLRAAYIPIIERGTPVEVMDLPTAELVKVAANSFLATKISFINAMSEVCDAAGADVVRLADALAHDTRIGGRFLRPGLGFGGGCLPKDIRAFGQRAREIGAGESVTFLDDVDAVNLRARSRVVDQVVDLLDGKVEGARVAVLGAAFKPDSDDIRDSPALDVSTVLHGLGAEVTVADPAAIDNARRSHPQLNYATSAESACLGADVVLLLTEWPEYRRMAPDALRDLVSQPLVLDARHALDPDAWVAQGWSYYAPGRPPRIADRQLAATA